ncbi:MAG: ABC transporter transmembrane domain-containing protein [Alphaproteobacteria bacterium]|nr:ABC transporter transmembrane domain-containing protein [Alphaproteobacteria bacterium]
MTETNQCAVRSGTLQTGNAQSSFVLLKRLVRAYLRPHIKHFIAAMLFMAVAASMRGVFTHTLQLVIDGMIERRGLVYMSWVCALIIASFWIRSGTVYLHTILMNRIGQRIVATVQQEMCSHLLRSDLSFFHANASGTLVSRVINDVTIMRQAVNECLLNSFRGGLELASLIGVMFYQDWHLSLIVFAVFPLSAYYVARIGKKIRRLASNTQNATGDLSALLNQTFQGIRHVKAYGNENLEVTRVNGLTEAIYKFSLKSIRVSALTGPVMEVLSSVAITSLVVYGYLQVERGTNTPGDLVAFIASFVLAYDPMKRMGRVSAQLQAGLAAAERVFSVLDVTPSIADAPKAKEFVSDDYTVELDNVVFSYPDGTRALDHLSIEVPHGKTVAIVGSSGAGKSTIINLIPRFYDVQAGRISIGGTDVRDVTMCSLRSKIALVSQETALFDDTIRANIAYGKIGASAEEVEAAAAAASADGFIRELPNGYDTHVGEFGVKLSGGQRQRIAIARAMLRNAPVLLLDEATSALDNESERAVQAALKRLQEGRTTIVVAHRLSTIVDADLIIVLDQGRVAEQGTHSALLAKGGVYARLYGLQGNCELKLGDCQ